jgi:hypothetical protein
MEKITQCDLVQTYAPCASKTYSCIEKNLYYHASFSAYDVGLVLDIKRRSDYFQNYFVKIIWNDGHIAWIHHSMIKKI